MHDYEALARHNLALERLKRLVTARAERGRDPGRATVIVQDGAPGMASVQVVLRGEAASWTVAFGVPLTLPEARWGEAVADGMRGLPGE